MSAKENYRQILYQQPVGNCKIITHSCGLFTSSFQDTPKVNIAKNIVNTAGCFLISCQNPSSLKSVGASRPPADVFAFILGEENAPRQRSGRANRLFFQGKGYVLFGTIASGEGFGEKTEETFCPHGHISQVGGKVREGKQINILKSTG